MPYSRLAVKAAELVGASVDAWMACRVVRLNGAGSDRPAGARVVVRLKRGLERPAMSFSRIERWMGFCRRERLAL
jgi:hypothetical protein